MLSCPSVERIALVSTNLSATFTKVFRGKESHSKNTTYKVINISFSIVSTMVVAAMTEVPVIATADES